MIDPALHAALVTALRRSFPGQRDDARDRELGEVADTVAGIVRAHDGAKVVGLRGALNNSVRVTKDDDAVYAALYGGPSVLR